MTPTFTRAQAIAAAKAKADTLGRLSAWGLRSLIADWEAALEKLEEADGGGVPPAGPDLRALSQRLKALPLYQQHDVVRRPSTTEYFNAEHVEELLDAALAAVPCKEQMT